MRLRRGAHSESVRMNPPNPDARLWLFDFDNTLAALEREVDWPGSRRELEVLLRDEGVDENIFAEIPKGNLPLYAALHTRWLRASSTEANMPTAVQTRLRGQFISAAGRPPRETAKALLRRSSEIIERHELIGVERAQPTAGAIDLLKVIFARGATVVIVTSNSSRTVARWLELHGIGNLVRATVGRDSLLALKPSPEMVVRALKIATTPAADTVFVGDSEADLGAACAVGLGFYGIATSDSVRDRLAAAGAPEVFASPAALRSHSNLAHKDPTSEAD
jgi:phosphoglycolate phosphatase-like HAD superfamily hydrolase